MFVFLTHLRLRWIVVAVVVFLMSFYLINQVRKKAIFNSRQYNNHKSVCLCTFASDSPREIERNSGTDIRLRTLFIVAFIFRGKTLLQLPNFVVVVRPLADYSHRRFQLRFFSERIIALKISAFVLSRNFSRALRLPNRLFSLSISTRRCTTSRTKATLAEAT